MNRNFALRVLGIVACAAVMSLPMTPGRAAAPAGQFTNNGNSTITDNRSGLIWQRTFTATEYTHANAVTYCANLTLGGSSNWRLPEIAELQSLYDTCEATHLDPTYFPGTQTTYFWSNTTYVIDTTQAWNVRNDSTHSAKTSLGQVRCVR